MSTQGAPNPARVAAVEAHAAARHAHHEAGHAVAAVARGGELVDVFLGTAYWSIVDSTADTPGGTVHRAAWAAQPFVTFAGPWAEARWTVENDPDVAGIERRWSSHGATTRTATPPSTKAASRCCPVWLFNWVSARSVVCGNWSVPTTWSCFGRLSARLRRC